ncbi:MAG: cupin domain-containing protein [Ignavibacteria bacterium]|nr:cupin domain-containing protein [Ignavibacteria bacterium]
MKNTSSQWIKNLNMKTHPEGGFFKEVYRSDLSLKKEHLPDEFSGDRNISTSIYYLLSENDKSRFHRILSDELWHFYDGGTLLIFEIDTYGLLKVNRLGMNTEEGDLPQVVIKAGNWFGAALQNKNSYCLAGCTVSPGFHFEDFELADRKELLNTYPEHTDIINLLT